MKNVLFISVLLCIVLASIVQASNYADVVSQLHRLQDPSGAFKASQRAPASLEATQDALFLNSLYGLRKKIDTSVIPGFLNSLKNSDGGYGESFGAPSTVESTWKAVTSYAFLRVSVPESAKTIAFLRSQVDNSGLFVSAPGNAADIISTYYAIEALSILGDSVDANLVKGYLQSHENEAQFAFATQTENLYAILVANLVGYSVANPQAFARNIGSYQVVNGGFIDETNYVSFPVTSLSVQAVSVLEKLSGESLSNFVNFDNLVSFVQTVPFDVSLVADAHKAVAFSPYFKNNFRFFANFDSTSPVKDNLILIGSQYKPTFVARAFGGSSSDFSVEATLTNSDLSTSDLSVSWDNDAQLFASDFLSASTLGPITIQYKASYVLPTVGELSLTHVVEASIGYSVVVTSDATHELTGRKISIGETVSSGTVFAFTVTPKDKSSKVVSSGDFQVALTVLDSSNIPVDSQSISATETKGPFQFTYTLSDNTLPAGHLTFNFELKNTNGKTFNSYHVQYLISTPLIATQLNVDAEYQLGDEVEVTFVPAVFPDHRDVHPLNPLRRNFVLDITSSSGKVLGSFRGVPTTESVSFTFTIEPSFDSIGTSLLSIRYVTFDGLSVLLGNYDASTQDLSEEPAKFTVNAELHVVEISEQPGSNDFFYGNEITFKYTVEDKLSEKKLSQGKYGYSFLALNHFDEKTGRSFTSTKEAAVQTRTGELLVSWEINPNAVEGQGTLVLAAVDASGNDIPLLEAKSQKSISYDVTIGGEISHQEKFFDFKDFYSTKSSFVLEFDLTCHHKALKNAKLRASVLRSEGGKFVEVASVPVAASGESYSISYSAKHKDLTSGDYKVQVFREIDQTRAAEAEDYKQKLLRQKQREAELNGEKFDEQQFLDSLNVESEVKPILETTFTHKEVTKGGLFIRTEWFVLVPLVAGFLYFDGKKRSYNQTNKF